MTLSAAKGSSREKSWRTGKPTLPAGRYLLKIYVDSKEQLKADWHAELGNADFVGQAEVESRWPEGYGRMTALDARKVKR